MAIKNLEKMDIYNPTNYVNNSEPDIDADNLNKTENKLEETVAKANEIIDALKTLISTVQTNSDNTVPSSSLAYVMQQEITKNKEDIAAANSNLVNLNAWSSSVTMREAEAITMPSNRFILFFLNPSTTSGAYARISVNGNNNMIRLVASSGEGITQCVSIAKNSQIQATAISGGTLSYRFMGN